MSVERRAILIRGTVQGVGFRPYVYVLASRYALHGFVRNQVSEVRIEVEGESNSLAAFVEELPRELPPLARIDELHWERQTPRGIAGESSFRIEHSVHEESQKKRPVTIAADAAMCEACRHELLDPNDRRYRYPFLNCTHCGPRLTIITGAPYDRERTTMAPFPMCPACRAEYEDPHNRRFHAQPTACPQCGPQLAARDADGHPVDTASPLGWFVAALQAGKIGAIKGLGGYHLVCDARNQAAVAELRRRKHREAKPFAVMVADVVGAEELCEVNDLERELLTSRRRPIVLLRQWANAAGAERVAPEVAPGNPCLGVMLPYTPLHYLLMDSVAGDSRRNRPLVMTSGNRSDEPIAYRDEELLANLGGIADLYLTHNRAIHVRCDDSVTRVVVGQELPVRRSRGYAPQPIVLPSSCPQPMLALGGQQKATFALSEGVRVVLSHHLGDLDHFAACQAFERDVRLYETMLEIHPQCLIHDLHPDYASTRYALGRSATEGLPHMAVQHHHAHLASCMAEHGLQGPVLGVIFDGTGYGVDGAVWGGEFLLGDYTACRRVAHLRYVGMPGAEQAVREPWRMALAHLLDADADIAAVAARLGGGRVKAVRQMLARRFNTPWTSSMGRLFDAVSALAGICQQSHHEGQAAMMLEWTAAGGVAEETYPYGVLDVGEQAADGLAVDCRPLIRAVAEDVAHGQTPCRVAQRFHATVADIVGVICTRVRQECGVETVALSGGVWMNALLTQASEARLTHAGFRVCRHRLVPPNDGGLSLGQIAVAAARGSHRTETTRGDAYVSGNPR